VYFCPLLSNEQKDNPNVHGYIKPWLYIKINKNKNKRKKKKKKEKVCVLKTIGMYEFQNQYKLGLVYYFLG
jgi:hypothetical protein